jgi:hypothetical protein
MRTQPPGIGSQLSSDYEYQILTAAIPVLPNAQTRPNKNHSFHTAEKIARFF